MILDSIRSPKRGKNERSGIHNWHPYYAGFSEGFVRDVIEGLAIRDNVVILDPWNGSGTTTFVAQRLGYRSIGVEINPVMVIYSRAKELDIPDKMPVTRLRSIIDEIWSQQSKYPSASLTDLFESILLIRGQSSYFELPSAERTRAVGDWDSVTALLVAAAFRVLRSTATFARGTNPMWLREAGHGNSTSASVNVWNMFRLYANSMVDQLLELRLPISNVPCANTLLGNAKALPMESESVDLVITSPPYCTRIDYVVPTRPELYLIGLTETDMNLLRRSTMGAPLIVDKQLEMCAKWGGTCSQLLESVGSHPSKAAKSYYQRTLIQYFRDAYESLAEIVRVLTKGGSAAVVVQSSYFKDMPIPLGDIFAEMARSLGVRGSIERREVVRQHMAHLNSRSRKYVGNKVYYEDVVLVRK